MTVVDHFIQGAVSMDLLVIVPLARRFNKPSWLRPGCRYWWILIIVFGLQGAAPDLIGFYGTAILRDDWQLYNRAHSGDIAAICNWSPPYFLHTAIDGEMHKPDGHWWPREWRIALVCWILELWALNAYRRLFFRQGMQL